MSVESPIAIAGPVDFTVELESVAQAIRDIERQLAELRSCSNTLREMLRELRAVQRKLLDRIDAPVA